MKTILLMRHAKSSWKNSNLADHDRPLNKRGKRDAPRMGALLNLENLVPDTILCSTALRAKMTVEGILHTCGFEGEVSYLRSLYHGGPDDYFEALSKLQEEIQSAMIIGHNPDMEYFLDLTCDVQEHMSTSAIAIINLSTDNWSEINEEIEGELIHLWKPRELKHL
jgi:phosphohistidine phosphatase